MLNTKDIPAAIGEGLTDKVYADTLSAIVKDDSSKSAKLLSKLHPSDIADFLERLPLGERHAAVNHIPKDLMGDVLASVNDGVRESLFEDFSQEELVEALSTLESDEIIDIVQDLPEEQAEETIKSITDGSHELLEYAEDTAGGIMHLEYLALPENIIVSDALKYMRENSDLIPQDIDSVYVINKNNKLLGSITVSRLVRLNLKAKLEDEIWEDSVTVNPEMDQEDVAHLFEKYDMHSCAVVDEEHRLLGVIAVDDILDVIMEEHEEDIMRAAGLTEGADLFAPMIDTTRRRLPWLLVNLFTAILASLVIAQFEAEIDKLVALAVLMPIVASMGGNAGTQTLTVVVRGLGLKQITMQNALSLLKKEFIVGGFNGMLLALLLAGGTIAFYGNVMLGVVICIATIANHFLAAVAGLVIPLFLEKIGKDPAISSGVLLTTVTDVCGFFVFLGLAALLLL